MLLKMIAMLKTQLLDELKERAKRCSQGRRGQTLLSQAYIALVYLKSNVVVATTVSCVTEAVSATGASPELLIPVC